MTDSRPGTANIGATDPQAEMKSRLLDAALIHVAFDGWSDGTFRAACRDAGIDPAVARVICPRGAVDLALAYHDRCDQVMLSRLAGTDQTGMRFRDRIVTALRYRIEAIDDKEAVRRATALLSLPPYAGDGARALWTTADRIWTTLGDTSDDINWYSKRMSLSGVLGSTVLYWLGDESVDHADTWAFLHRRVENVLAFEKLRSRITGNPAMKVAFAGPNWLIGKVRAPTATKGAYPGRWGKGRRLDA
ncbi:COQ9 family protein [Tropicimonas sp. IMCC34043]|uniref:COQ9 family protein n=1 Tax=Tropicimonas sp. IMCC34043 TaxID=2248760 RepID=UPI000E26F818|nr:COQ9 family protein [Tropicimonas sp. IMCC34043]